MKEHGGHIVGHIVGSITWFLPLSDERGRSWRVLLEPRPVADEPQVAERVDEPSLPMHAPGHLVVSDRVFLGAGGTRAVLLALVVWMVMRVRRDMSSRGGRVQLYVVFTILALGAVGGGWQTVSEAAEGNP